MKFQNQFYHTKCYNTLTNLYLLKSLRYFLRTCLSVRRSDGFPESHAHTLYVLWKAKAEDNTVGEGGRGWGRESTHTDFLKASKINK